MIRGRIFTASDTRKAPKRMALAETTQQPAYFAGMDASGSKAADQARQILDTTRPFRSTPDDALVVLDLGCGYGYTAVALANMCKHVVAIEPSPDLFRLASSVVQERKISNVELRNESIEWLNERNRFDLVILDNVLEHVADQEKALRAVAAALKPGGLLYLLVPNKLWPIEAHYGLPFLSYLPLPVANRYLRLTKRGTDYTDASYAPTYGRLIRLLKMSGFDHHLVVPDDLSLTVEGAALHYRMGAAVLRRAPWLWRLAKGFLVVATKQ